MKAKKITSLICALAMLCSFSVTSAFAAGNDVTVAEPMPISASAIDISMSDGIQGSLVSTASENGIAVANVTTLTATTYQPVTTSITDANTYHWYSVPVPAGGIMHASLECPANANVNFALAVATIGSSGYPETVLAACDLATAIDPSTGGTLDESIAYINTGTTATNYALLVMLMSSDGTAAQYTLNLSTDISGSYGTAEPNENAFDSIPLTATSSNPLTISGSGMLNSPVDQDWYEIQPTSDGIFAATAGSYTAEIYTLTDNGGLVLASRSPAGYYLLDAGQYYYVKVYFSASTSTAAVNSVNSDSGFTPGTYPLSVSDQSIYDTMAEAYNLGYWMYSTSTPPSIPWGQAVGYYRFTIDDDEGVYAKIEVPDDGSTVTLSALNSQGTPFEVATSSSPSNVVTPSNQYLPQFIAVNIDSDAVSDGIVYLQVVYENPNAYHTSPSVRQRLYHGSGDFEVTSLCLNAGNGLSNAVSLNLTNETSIPQNAIVSSVRTDLTLSSSVGGITHQIQPGNFGWFESSAASAGDGIYNQIDESLGIPMHLVWQFRYNQSAYLPTEVEELIFEFEWIEDIQYNNYEIYTSY